MRAQFKPLTDRVCSGTRLTPEEWELLANGIRLEASEKMRMRIVDEIDRQLDKSSEELGLVASSIGRVNSVTQGLRKMLAGVRDVPLWPNDK